MRAIAFRKGSLGLALALIVAALAGCASSDMGGKGAAPSVDVTGKWAGPWEFENASLGAGTITLTLKQAGNKVTGDVDTLIGPTRHRPQTVEGVVSGNTFQLTGNYSGSFTVTGNRMQGIVYGVVPARVSLTKQ